MTIKACWGLCKLCRLLIAKIPNWFEEDKNREWQIPKEILGAILIQFIVITPIFSDPSIRNLEKLELAHTESFYWLWYGEEGCVRTVWVCCSVEKYGGQEPHDLWMSTNTFYNQEGCRRECREFNLEVCAATLSWIEIWYALISYLDLLQHEIIS